MVLQKRLDYGFNGYQVPSTPKATRSARKRGTIQKRDEEKQMFAFDLLATVAGNLLLEKECSAASSDASSEKEQCKYDRKQCYDADKQWKAETSDEGSYDRRYFGVAQAYDQGYSTKESPIQNPINVRHSGFASTLTSSCSEQFLAGNLRNEKGCEKYGSFASKFGVGCSDYAESSGCKLGYENNNNNKVNFKLLRPGKVGTRSGKEANVCMDEDGAVDGKSTALLSSDGIAKPLHDGHTPHSSSSQGRDDVKVYGRDDDENSSGCTYPSSTTMPLRSVARIGDRRIRKILASKCWKVAPIMKDKKLSNNDGDSKSIHSYRKNSNKCHGSQMNIPFKKRRLFDSSSVSNSDGGIRSDDISYHHDKGIRSDACGPTSRTHGVPDLSCSLGQSTSSQSGDSHVRLKIKSFRVPELFIEIPETATIGSLKRSVTKAVSAILGGGLRIGVILQGKKIRDNCKTLLQMGISHGNQLDALGFTLEPNPSKCVTSIHATDSPHIVSSERPQCLTRYSPIPNAVHQRFQGSFDVLPEPEVTKRGNSVESDHDSAPSLTSTAVDNGVSDSRALVAIPETGMEALAVVPAHKNSKCSEVVQRRIRRPFSVAEVEALVQAVEKLGTGRWRDVKLCAFDDAKHRTYVDLKDKWKTLVHTARISPQQRRGEPVPQELLNRVLTAHAYWSQQQTKQQFKQQPETCLLL